MRVRMRNLQLVWLLFTCAVRCQNDNITTILTKADATSIAASSPTVYGSLVIGPDMTGTVELEGIKKITGDLTCQHLPGLTGISSSTLANISGSMTLLNLSSFSNLELPSLESLEQISWTSLPALSQPILTRRVKYLSRLYVRYTNLVNLDKITPQSLKSINIIGNPLLRTISISLASGADVLFRDNRLLSEVDLGKANSVKDVVMDGNFTSIRGLSGLTSVEGSLEIDSSAKFDCEYLASIKFGDIDCVSENSTYSVVKTSDGRTDWRVTYPHNYKAPEDPVPNIVGLVVGVCVFPIIVCLIIVFYRNCIGKNRKASLRDPEIPELPLGGHSEKTELEARERPGELAVFRSNSAIELDTLHPHANGNVKANITDISDIDFNPFLGRNRTKDRTNLARKNSMEITSVV